MFITYNGIYCILWIEAEESNTGGLSVFEKRGSFVNIAYFLLPKNRVAYLYDDCTFRQGLEKMRHHGYTAIPVITREGKSGGTVSEGDFLWRLLENGQSPSKKDLEQLRVRDLLHDNQYQPVRITVSMEELLTNAMNQNFIPVIDDTGSFIGIITRKDIIRYFAEGKSCAEKSFLQKIV